MASLVSPKGRAQNAVSNARRHATQYLDANFESDPGLRQKTYDKLLDEEQTILGLPEKYRARIREEEKLMRLLSDAHAEHDAYLERPGTTGDARTAERLVT